jgi:hypothetical protein
MRRLGVRLILTYLWIIGLYRRVAARGGDRDRGDALSTAAIAAGMLIIVGVVIAILKTKAAETAQNVCTAADPATCQ